MLSRKLRPETEFGSRVEVALKLLLVLPMRTGPRIGCRLATCFGSRNVPITL
jgi:hypothetical protein